MQNRTSLLATAAVVALVAGVAPLARAQDPPADLLEHVKVGQRWTFATTVGDFRTEEVLHVAEVNGAEGWVSYLRSTRTHSAGKLVTETVAQELERWSGGTRLVIDAPTLLAMKATQTRQSFKAPGVTLDAFVLTTGGAAEAWTAARGDFETFPGQLKLVTEKVTVRLLEKVEDGPPPVVPTKAPEEVLEGDSNLPKGALDHVKVGQRWIFKARNSGAELELVWKVTAVDAAQGMVRYDVTSVMKTADGSKTPLETSTDQEWSAGAVPVLEAGVTVAGVSGERKPLAVPGATLECYVVKTDVGDLHLAVWSAVKGSREVFPGVVKQVSPDGGLELLRVEGP